LGPAASVNHRKQENGAADCKVAGICPRLPQDLTAAAAAKLEHDPEKLQTFSDKIMLQNR
jgi:hypothetical protein